MSVLTPAFFYYKYNWDILVTFLLCIPDLYVSASAMNYILSVLLMQFHYNNYINEAIIVDSVFINCPRFIRIIHITLSVPHINQVVNRSQSVSRMTSNYRERTGYQEMYCIC